jgi:hypothetical protein
MSASTTEVSETTETIAATAEEVSHNTPTSVGQSQTDVSTLGGLSTDNNQQRKDTSVSSPNQRSSTSTTNASPRTPRTPRTPGGTESTPVPPTYLTEIPSNKVVDVVKLVKKHAREEANEEGDGGDSDVDADAVDDHQEAMELVLRDRAMDVANGDDDMQLTEDNERCATLLHVGAVNVIE